MGRFRWPARGLWEDSPRWRGLWENLSHWGLWEDCAGCQEYMGKLHGEGAEKASTPEEKLTRGVSSRWEDFSGWQGPVGKSL